MAHVDKLLQLPIDRLTKRFESEPTDDQSVARYHELLGQREDSGEELLRLAGSTTNDCASGAALLLGILRSAAEGKVIPGRMLDERLRFGKLVEPSWDLTSEWPGLGPFLAAVDALGRERGANLARTMLEETTGYGKAWLMLHRFADDRLLLERAVTLLAEWRFPTSGVAMGVAMFPPETLGFLRPEALPEKSYGRSLAALGMQGSLARVARAEGTWDQEFDHVLDVDWSWPDGDHLFAIAAAPAIKTVIGALSAERAMSWLERQLEPARPSSMRALLAVPRTQRALVDRLLRFVDGNARLVKKPATDWLGAFAAELGPDGPELASRLTRKKARTSFEAGLVAAGPAAAERDRAGAEGGRARRGQRPKKPARVTKVEELARSSKAEGPGTWLVALEAAGKPDADTISRVGGPGYDLGDERPESDGLPMVHVFTIALDDLPALGGGFPGAVALSLYVAEPGDLEGVELDGALIVPLDAATMNRGLAAATSRDLPEKAIGATRIELPAGAFGAPSSDPKLLRAITKLPARAGGAPVWLQEPAGGDGFLLQFDARFAPLNLGDAGCLYVFRDGVVWQSL